MSSGLTIAYREKPLTPAVKTLVEIAAGIIHEYRGQGLRLTVRQLYYQLVARGLIPNRVQEYKRLVKAITDGRMTGDVPWDSIEDRGREVIMYRTYDNPTEFLNVAADWYREDVWRAQGMYVEVWIEKQALVGVLEDTCDEFRVPLFACKGYPSASEVWRAAYYRFTTAGANDKDLMLIHLGDHDPSGLDMTRDIQDRLDTFLDYPIRVNRVALTMEQIEELKPPPNPAKTTDSRYAGYMADFGDESWELDAIPPDRLQRIVRNEVEFWTDGELLAEALEAEAENRAAIRKAISRK